MSKYKLPLEMVAQLQQEQRNLHDILEVIDDAEECGVDCQLYRATQKEAHDRISAILAKFGPNAR